MSGVLFIIARNYPKHIQGISEWSLAAFIMALAIPLFIARNHIPDFLSIAVANLMILICLMVMNSGIRKFAGIQTRINKSFLYLFIGTHVSGLIWFTYIQPYVTLRVLWISSFSFFVVLDQLILVIKKLPGSAGRSVLIVSLAGLIITGVILLASLALGYSQAINIFDTSPLQLLLLATPAIMVPLVTVSYIMLASEKIHTELEFISQHDDLTGCLNKKTVLNRLEQEISRANRYQYDLTMMLIDLDDFKKINDAYGHLEGDKVLMNFTGITRQSIRNTDIIGRFGGDEFLVILPNTNIKKALVLSDRIHKAAADSSHTPWSVSIGISEWQGKQDSLNDLFTRADRSLYLSKQLGKNQTQVTQEPI